MNEVERGGGVGGSVGNSQSFPQGFSQAGQNGSQFGQNVPRGMSFSQEPVSSGAGDIILDTGAGSGGKSRKWIVVVLIVVVVLVVLVGGGVALWKSGVLGGESVEPSDVERRADSFEELKNYFNGYANFLIYGEESDAQVADFNPSDDLFIDSNWNNLDYLTNLSSKYEKFYNESNKDFLTSLGDLSLGISKDNIDFLIEYANVNWINAEDVYEKFNIGGKEAAVEYVEKYYDGSKDEAPSLAVEYDITRMLARINFWNHNAGPEEIGNSDERFNSLIKDAIKTLKMQCQNINVVFMPGELEEGMER